MREMRASEIEEEITASTQRAHLQKARFASGSLRVHFSLRESEEKAQRVPLKTVELTLDGVNLAQLSPVASVCMCRIMCH
jgi:hypothetical protein